MAHLASRPDFGTLPVAATHTAYVSPSSAAARHVGEVFHAVASLGARLSVPEVIVLSCAVGRPGQCRPGVIGRAASLSPSNVTRALHRLEELGMVERRPDPKSRRSVLVHPTADGRAWVEAVAKTLGAA